MTQRTTQQKLRFVARYYQFPYSQHVAVYALFFNYVTDVVRGYMDATDDWSDLTTYNVFHLAHWDWSQRSNNSWTVLSDIPGSTCHQD